MTNTDQSTSPAPATPTDASTAPVPSTFITKCRLLRPPLLWVLLALLGLQYVVIQAVLQVQYGDGPRNLYWATRAYSDPRFLLGASDPTAMIDGFVPEPATLAPAGFVTGESVAFHRWWGPVPPLVMGGLWWLSGSDLLLGLAVPLVAGGAVLACYGLGRSLFDRETGLLAAALLAFLPLFYQHAVINYSEVISALFLTLALWSYLQGRTLLTFVFGTVTLLCKMDMAVLYGGVVGLSLLYRLWQRAERAAIGQSLVVLIGPGLLLAGWYWLRTGSPLPSGTGRGLSVEIFQLLALDMLQGFFFVPWYIAILTLSIIGYCVARGLGSPRLDTEQRLILGSWALLGFVVLLVYMFTPGASNSPRVVLPSMPAVALLAVVGWQQLEQAWRRRIALYMGTLCVLTSLIVVVFVASHRPYYEVQAGLWGWLREQPADAGYVLAPDLWYTRLYGDQPITWFESDPQFQRNILHDEAHFGRYVGANPIRYVVVPRPEAAAVLAGEPLELDQAELYSEDVLAYLEATAERVETLPYYDVYILPEGEVR